MRVRTSANASRRSVGVTRGRRRHPRFERDARAGQAWRSLESAPSPLVAPAFRGCQIASRRRVEYRVEPPTLGVPGNPCKSRRADPCRTTSTSRGRTAMPSRSRVDGRRRPVSRAGRCGRARSRSAACSSARRTRWSCLIEDGAIVFVNAQVKALFGYEPDELIGKSVGAAGPRAFPRRRTADTADRFRGQQRGACDAGRARAQRAPARRQSSFPSRSASARCDPGRPDGIGRDPRHHRAQARRGRRRVASRRSRSSWPT